MSLPIKKSTAKTASLPIQKLAAKTASLPIKKLAAKTESSILYIYIYIWVFTCRFCVSNRFMLYLFRLHKRKRIFIKTNMKGNINTLRCLVKTNDN
jgi:hypothetical protein